MRPVNVTADNKLMFVGDYSYSSYMLMAGSLLKVGVSSLCFFQESFDSLLTKIPMAGIKLWEIADDGLHSLNGSRVQMLNDLRESHDLLFNVHTPWTAVNISAMHPNVREKVQETVIDSIQFASEIGSEHVVIHPGRSSHFVKGTSELCWSYTADFLKRAADFCADRGITPLLENIFPPYFLFHDPDEIERYFREDAPENLRFVCDFGHANVTGNLLPLVEKTAGYIEYVHLSGNHGEKDEHLPIDEGNVKWKEGLDVLFEAGFDGTIIVENYNLDDAYTSLETLRSFVDSKGRNYSSE